jgi:hypothetical protein
MKSWAANLLTEANLPQKSLDELLEQMLSSVLNVIFRGLLYEEKFTQTLCGKI